MIDLKYYLAFVNKKYSPKIPDVLFPTKRICYVIIRKEGLLKVIKIRSIGINHHLRGFYEEYKIKY